MECIRKLRPVANPVAEEVGGQIEPDAGDAPGDASYDGNPMHREGVATDPGQTHGGVGPVAPDGGPENDDGSSSDSDTEIGGDVPH